MDVIAAYRDVGSYRGAAAICGTTHKTVKRIIEQEAKIAAGEPLPARVPRERNFDAVADLVAEKIAKTSGRISAMGGRRRSDPGFQAAFADLPVPVEIRNQARVHLWYEGKFGVPCPQHTSTEAAIDSFEATTCCLGVRVEADGHWRVYAPHGLSAVFNLVVRPNPAVAPCTVYEAKTSRWQRQWPALTILLWPKPAY